MNSNIFNISEIFLDPDLFLAVDQDLPNQMVLLDAIKSKRKKAAKSDEMMRRRLKTSR